MVVLWFWSRVGILGSIDLSSAGRTVPGSISVSALLFREGHPLSS